MNNLTKEEALILRIKEQCPQKLRYTSNKEAKAVAKHLRKLKGSKLRVYHCPVCDGYHLTSMSLRLSEELTAKLEAYGL